MSSKVVLLITRRGVSGLRLLPLYFGCVMSISWNLFPSLLICQWTFSGDGTDWTIDVIIVSEANSTFGGFEMFTNGASEIY